MVKADAKCDYYADLELAPTADAEEIKKQFRALAKQYHPDRNPGREVDVLAKFQAVQAAHEVLSDPQQKKKYDADRAKLNRAFNINNNDADPYQFRKPAPRNAPQTAQTQYPPPPPTPRSRPARSPYDAPGGRGTPTAASTAADKFNAFTRPTQSWDRAKFDEAARADAARGFASMRSNPSAPQPPPRPPRHPTASRAYDNGPSPDMPPPHAGQSAGYPGLPRAASARFTQGPSNGGEPPIQRHSAYANYARGERPQVSNPQNHFSDTSGPYSPMTPRQKPAVSPLRHVRSSVDDSRPQRPALGRESSKYATAGGERTNINGPGVARSASVRNSPVEKNWDEGGRNGFHRPHSHHGPTSTRHRSHSPITRPSGINSDDVSSESSSSEDDAPTMKHSRPKAQARKPRPHAQTTSTGHGYRSYQPDNPGLTEPVSSTNYTKVVEDDPSKYPYPPPRSSNGPVRRPFPNMTTAGPDGFPGPNIGGIRRSETWAPKYDPFHSNSRSWSKEPGCWRPRSSTSGSWLNGLPSWQVPSSVFPERPSKIRAHVLSPVIKTEPSRAAGHFPKLDRCAIPTSYQNSMEADLTSKSSSASAHAGAYSPTSPQDPHNVSQENINATFSAADWEGKFTSGDEYFRPTESQSREHKSPTRTHPSRTHSQVRRPSMSQGQDQATDETTEKGEDLLNTEGDLEASLSATQSEASKAAAFQRGIFSAEEWAEKLKDQKWSIPNNELNANRSKTPKRGSKSTTFKRPPAMSQTSEAKEVPGQHTISTTGIPSHSPEDPDAMEIDEDTPESVPPVAPANENPVATTKSLPRTDQSSSAANGIDLQDFKKTAPFAPSGTGLKDFNDLATTLPFESRAAPAVKYSRGHSSSIRHLNLPKPPRTIAPPLAKDITQERWESYVHDVNDYLHDWNVFNIKMVDHFRSRQDQINVGMQKHWISSIGDGPPAENFDCARDLEALDGPKAGYATYMTWLEDDAKCRAWWDEAYERHRLCFEGLGKVREHVKGLE